MLWHRRDGHSERDVYELDGHGGDKDRASQVQSCGGGVRGEGGADLQIDHDLKDEDNLKNKDDHKNEDKNEDDLKKEDYTW